MPLLPDGTVVSSTLHVPGLPSNYSDGGMFGNVLLRLGEVQDIVYPDDQRNFSKKFIEYRVFVQHRANDTTSAKIYEHCFLINPLSGLADKATWTLRAEKSASLKNARGIAKGSKVLLLCVNGETNNAVIIGGIKDYTDTSEEKYTKDSNPGHHAHLVFNGIDFFINDDGELTLSYLGKTNNDGSVASSVDPSAPGTTVKMLKNGNLQIATKNNDQTFLIDHENKKIDITANSQFNVNVGGSATITAGSTMTLKASALTIATAGGISMTSSGVSTGKATDKTLMGSTFRQAQADLNQNLMQGLNSLASQLATAGATFLIPFTPAGMALVQAATAASSMAGAIADFESNAEKYLSDRNLSD